MTASPSFEPDQYCPAGFEGAEEDTAASIIHKAAMSCGINPQVLLTTLQKEQGLITASGLRLNEGRYTIAMGYACPDSSNCDEQYFGFATQVYYAARQMRVYEQNPYKYMARPYENIYVPPAGERPFTLRTWRPRTYTTTRPTSRTKTRWNALGGHARQWGT